jgi:hypothetical protein
MPELERILKVHQVHKPPEMFGKERGYDPPGAYLRPVIKEVVERYLSKFS